jgi:hypothetical protein
MSSSQTVNNNPNGRRGLAKDEGGIVAEERPEPAAIKAKYGASLLNGADRAASLPAVSSTAFAPTTISCSHPTGAPNPLVS